MTLDYNPVPGIYFFENDGNPTVTSPNSPYEISFYQTRDTMVNPELYESFIYNAVSRFRKSVTYTNYKQTLYEWGLNHSQIHGNISSEMASLEMHHNIITVFDVAMIMCEHLLNTRDRVCTFDIIMLLKRAHVNNQIPLIMLDITTHQVYHDDASFYIDPKQCVLWNFIDLLHEYYAGITKALAFKILNYFQEASMVDGTYDNQLLELREQIINWSEYNDQVYYKGV